MLNDSFTEKIRHISYILMPKVWKKRYEKVSLESTVMNGIYIEWWGWRKNLGDWLSLPVTEYMLQKRGISPAITRGGYAQQAFICDRKYNRI